jgi:hypothetical protein
MSRERLPNRRRSESDGVRWPLDGGKRIHVTAGFAHDDRLLECFLRGGGQVGSERDFLLDDVAVLISRLLQHGDTLADIVDGMGRAADGEVTSMIGAIAECLHKIEINKKGDG